MNAVPAVETALRRARAWQPWLNCFVEIDDDAALARAQRLDAQHPDSDEVDGGRVDGGAPGSRLHGLPIGYKDVFVRSRRTPRVGSRVPLIPRPTGPAEIERALEEAGTVTLGALHLDEFSYSATGRSDVLGDCHNPWDLTRATGGSSSGAAAAVAARILPLAIGTDTGGSGRLPAAWCGVVGFKPTFGMISTAGVVPLSPSQDSVALLALDVGLIREAYHTLRIRPRPAVRPDPLGGPRVPTGLRIGRLAGTELASADRDALAGLRTAGEALGDLGAVLVDTELGYLAECNSAAAIIIASEAAAIHHQMLRQHAGDYQAGTRTRLRVGQLLGAVDYVDALRFRALAIRRAMAETFAHVDIVLTPVAPSAAPELAALPAPSSPQLASGTGSLLSYTRPFNYLGFPSISVPMGFTGQGLPLAVQLTAAPQADSLLLDIAQALQSIINWSNRCPELPMGDARHAPAAGRPGGPG